MLVICEDCAKKYNIDESRIQGTRARFICKECGHIVVVNKPDSSSKPPVSPPGTSPGGSTIDFSKEKQGTTHPHVSEEMPEPSASASSQQIQEEQKTPPNTEEKDGGLPLSMLFIFALLYTIISTIGVLGYLYLGSFANVLNLDLPNVIVTSLSLVGVVAVVGIVIFLSLSRLITQPLAELTAAVNRIKDGGLDFPVVARGPREVRELATALERVRLSYKK